MRRTGIVSDERFLLHDTGPGHPERADRLRAIYAAIERHPQLSTFRRIAGVPVEMEWVRTVHCDEYTERLADACRRGQRYIDTPDSTICRESFEIARLAAGGVLAAVDAVMAGELDNAFCAIRPPGHHAENHVSMGFCLFNNIAIAAQYVRRRYGIERVFILDWDVHHGNGTQHTFEADPNVLFCSMHEHPRYLFPGTGWPNEQGYGDGLGTTINLTFLPHTGDGEWVGAFEDVVVPAAQRFAPQFVLVSAGFDAHIDDPLATLAVTDAAFAWISHRITELAGEWCDGRLVTLLEGGYDLDALSRCVGLHLEMLAGLREPAPIDRTIGPATDPTVDIRKAASSADEGSIFWW